MAIVLLEQYSTVLENQQTINILMRGDFIDRLFAPLEGNRKIRNEVIVVLKRKESIAIPWDVHRGDDFPHMAEGPAIYGAELEGFECQVLRPATFLGYRN